MSSLSSHQCGCRNLLLHRLAKRKCERRRSENEKRTLSKIPTVVVRKQSVRESTKQEYDGEARETDDEKSSADAHENRSPDSAKDEAARSGVEDKGEAVYAYKVDGNDEIVEKVAGRDGENGRFARGVGKDGIERDRGRRGQEDREGEGCCDQGVNPARLSSIVSFVASKRAGLTKWRSQSRRVLSLNVANARGNKRGLSAKDANCSAKKPTNDSSTSGRCSASAGSPSAAHDIPERGDGVKGSQQI